MSLVVGIINSGSQELISPSPTSSAELSVATHGAVNTKFLISLSFFNANQSLVVKVKAERCIGLYHMKLDITEMGKNHD
jgi:hypothetical protein